MRILPAILCCAFGLSLASAAEPAPVLRVLTWNIHHGSGTDGKPSLAQIAETIRNHQPDIVLLQEVDQNCNRSGKTDQTAELARLTGLHGAFGKAMDFDGGAYGQTILAKFPPANLTVHTLPSNGEARIAISAILDTPLGKVTAASVHLDHADDARRNAQAQVCAAALLASPHPVILAGDFNTTPENRAMAHFSQAPWSIVAKSPPAATYPATDPKSEIDHIVLRGLQAAGPATVPALPNPPPSDHRPVLTTVRLPE